MTAVKIGAAMLALHMAPGFGLAQAARGPVPEVEPLALHAACDRDGEQAVSVNFENLQLPITYPPDAGISQTERGFARRTGQGGNIRFLSRTAPEVPGAEHYPRDVDLNARLILCVSRDLARLGDAEWVMTGETAAARLHSQRKAAVGDISLEVERHTGGRMMLDFVIEDSRARLTERNPHKSYNLTIQVGFRFAAQSMEPTQ